MQNHSTTTPRLRRWAVGLFAGLVLTAGMLLPTARADAVVPTSHGTQVCNGRQIQARPPWTGRPTKLDYHGAYEKVYWRADLYRWDGKRWAAYSVNKTPWYFGLLMRNGVVYRDSSGYRWHQVPNHQPLYFVAFNNLPRGYYKTASTWYGTGAAWQSTGYCTVR